MSGGNADGQGGGDHLYGDHHRLLRKVWESMNHVGDADGPQNNHHHHEEGGDVYAGSNGESNHDDFHMAVQYDAKGIDEDRHNHDVKGIDEDRPAFQS